LILLFCIVLSLTFLIGTTVFYQTNISRLNEEYGTKVTELQQVEKELNTKIKILDQVKNDLKLKSEREQSFTQQFTEIKGEKETLAQAKEQLTTEKTSLQQQLNDAQAAKVQAEASAAFEQKRNVDLTTQLNDAKDSARAYSDELDSCKTSLDQCLHP
jgi:chromosome segregation ATPase